jgi:Family of unknown function (DUF6049)
MPRQCRSSGRRRPARSGHGAGLRLLALAAGVAAAALAAVPAAAASGEPGHLAAAVPLSIAITSVSPAYATPKGTVTVSGTVTNTTAAAITGLEVQLWSSSARLANRDAMDSYLTAGGVDSPTRSMQALASVAAHTTQRWSLALRVNQVGMTSFGVYPLAAQLSQFGAPVDAARTFLPFWPGTSASRKVQKVQPVTLAWIWPLIDVPHQTACPALLNNGLAASLASGGRLSELLAVGGSAVGRRADLTWAIDPALLNDARVMTAGYRVGGTATCSKASPHPASKAAQAWLAGIQSATARQDFFVTPYADVDVAALAHRGLNTELADAFADGRAVAQAKEMLGQAQRTTADPGDGPGVTGPIAWPADGIADYGVLESLAAPPTQVGTVILSSSTMPPSPPVAYTPTAVTTTPDGLGSQLNVLLADDGIGQILADPPDSLPGLTPGTGSPAAEAFAREQWFLAETAMIAAEAPRIARAVVVAPPRRWDPGPALASALLNETVSTPWLRPASLASLVTTARPTGPVSRQAPRQLQVSQDELRASLLRQVQRVEGQIGLLTSILVHPGPRYLSTAVDAVESTAWSGTADGRRTAKQLLHGISAYVAAQQQQVTIVDPLRVTLGGKSGEVPVSIANHLKQAIRVQLRVGPSPGRITIEKFTGLVTVAAGTQRTIKIPVRAAEAGTSVLTLWLTTPGGQRLPHSAARLTVEATHFGTMAIVIIGIALGVFVITAAARAIRRGMRSPAGDQGAGGTGEVRGSGPTGPDPAYTGQEADTVEPEQAGRSPAAKEPDEHASTPGWAERP